MISLRDFYPEANSGDWRLVDAGIRVQAIKSTDGKSGIVHYGTEIVSDERKSIAALLGASPGASVSASISLKLIETCFPQLLSTREAQKHIREMMPTYGIDLKRPESAEAFASASETASRTLQVV